MKRAIGCTLVLLWSIAGFGTGQFGDILIWKGDTLALLSNPLESHPDVIILKSRLFENWNEDQSTACWRGYIAEWVITEGQLYLTNIYSCDYRNDGIKADMKKLFGDKYKAGKTSAFWVTEELFIPMGELLYDFHIGYEFIYEKEIGLEFENGKLIRQNNYNNSSIHLSRFHENPDLLLSTINSLINWKSIPDLGRDTIMVYLSVTTGDTRKPHNIQIVRGSANPWFNTEAVRVAELLDDWDVFYKRGKAIRKGSAFPVRFSEEHRRKNIRKIP